MRIAHFAAFEFEQILESFVGCKGPGFCFGFVHMRSDQARQACFVGITAHARAGVGREAGTETRGRICEHLQNSI